MRWKNKYIKSKTNVLLTILFLLLGYALSFTLPTFGEKFSQEVYRDVEAYKNAARIEYDAYRSYIHAVKQFTYVEERISNIPEDNVENYIQVLITDLLLLQENYEHARANFKKSLERPVHEEFVVKYNSSPVYEEFGYSYYDITSEYKDVFYGEFNLDDAKSYQIWMRYLEIEKLMNQYKIENHHFDNTYKKVLARQHKSVSYPW